MNLQNVKFFKVLTLSVVAFIAIITNCCVWNQFASGKIETVYLVISILNFILEGIGIYFISKSWIKE